MSLTTGFNLVPRPRNIDPYPYSSICLHGIVLSYLGTGRTSPILPFECYDLIRKMLLVQPQNLAVLIATWPSLHVLTVSSSLLVPHFRRASAHPELLAEAENWFGLYFYGPARYKTQLPPTSFLKFYGRAPMIRCMLPKLALNMRAF